MAAQPDLLTQRGSGLHADPMLGVGRPEASMITLRRLTAEGHPVIDEAAGGRLGPARGLLLGLVLGLTLWAGIGLLAWRFFH